MKKLGFILIVVATVASATASYLPFSETFDVLSEGSLSAQNNWVVQSGTAVVQTNVVQSGKAVELSAASISQDLSSSNSVLWLTFWVRCEEASLVDPVITNIDTSVAFYINTNQHLVVYSNTMPVVLSTVIPTNVWTRFDVYCDYEELTWNLSVNQASVSAGLPLYSNNQQLNSVQIQNASVSSVYIDELSIVDYEPVTNVIDTDGDTIPDWWEQKYFGGITNAAPTTTNQNAYIAGLSPDADRFEISGTLGSTSTLQWVGQPSRRYSIYTTPDLLEGFTFQTNVLWSEAQYTDLINTNESAMFYRVYVELDN